ncbi:MAG: CoA transferase, partial [Dehalococcoidia bacterium]|nr:CoA transferase [Dehalococcoidia bacterium]
FVDLSQYEAMCILTAGEDNRLVAAPYGVYPCSGEDSWCAIAVFGDDEWYRLCDVMNMTSISDAPEFATTQARLKNRVELDKVITEWTLKSTAGEIMALLQKARVCAGAVQSARDIAVDEQLVSRGFFVELVGQDGRRLVFDGTPVRLSDGQAIFSRGAPALGAGNEYVYCGLLGMSREELARYIEKGVVY